MPYEYFPDEVVIDGVKITHNKHDKTKKNNIVHFDTKQHYYHATSLCGHGSVYSFYTIDHAEVTCKKCIKKLRNNNGC